MSKAGGSAFRKDVAFAETKDSDEFELEAAGIVMVPDVADLQNDFAREDTIRSFADQFATFAEAGQAGGGIMHAVWPDGWMELTRNEVLDEAEEIGERTVDAGAWVQRWGITNAELAGLIEDNILEGYSIGAIQVDWNGPFEQDEVDDVDTSELPDDELIWELTDGIIREVSAVDIPAVPDAQILDTKADAQKRLAEHVGNQDAFIEEAMERGHTEAEAERLWDVLNEAVEADGSAQPGKQTVFARAGKAFLGALFGSDDGTDASTSPEAPDQLTRADVLRTFPDDAPIPDDIEEFDECVDWAEEQEDIDDPDAFCGEYWEPENSASTKEGRTLSTANRESLFATVDASLDVLHDAGVGDLPKRFTDREDVDFHLDEHTARTWEGDHSEDDDEDGDEDEEEEAASTTEHATGGDTPDDNSPMSDDDDDGGKSLAEQNAEQIKELTDTVADLADAVRDEEEQTVEIELGGEVVEVAESEAKAWFDDEDEAGDPMAEAPAHVKALAEQVEEVTDRIERMNRQSGTSDQIHGAAQNGAAEDDPVDDLAKLLS